MTGNRKPPTERREAQTPPSNVHDLADARAPAAMSPALRKRAMARARIIDRLLEDEDGEDEE